jgi:hypothetical protein
MAVPASMGNMSQTQWDSLVASASKAREKFKANAEANKYMHNPGADPANQVKTVEQAPPVVQGTQQNNTQSMIDQLNAAKRQAVFAQLDKSRQGALSGLQAERAGIQPKYYDQRNQVAAGGQQQARNLAEFMANRGGAKSGSNAQATISNNMTTQGNLGALGRQEAQAYTDIERRTSDVNSAYEADKLSATAGIEADRMNAIINQMNTDRGFGIQEAGMTGVLNGQQTLGARSLGLQEQNQNFQQNMQTQQLERSNFESDRQFEMAKGQQEWNNAFAQGQFDFNKAQTAWDNTFKDKSFTQSMNEAAASKGLQWASLAQRDKEFLAQEEWNKKQFDHTKEQDTIQNNIAANKPADFDYRTDSVFIKGIAGAGTGDLTTAEILADAQNIMNDIGFEGYQKLLSAAKVYESSSNVLR